MSSSFPPPLPTPPPRPQSVPPPPLAHRRHQPIRGEADVRRRYVHEVERLVEEYAPLGVAGTIIVAVFLVLLTATVILIPFVVIRLVRYLKKRDSRRLTYERLLPSLGFVKEAQFVFAYPLMVNRALRRPGNQVSAGLVLITFDGELGENMRRMMDLAIAGGSSGAAGPAMLEADRQFCSALMEDEQFTPFRRRPIPPSIAGGSSTYACDLAIHPLLLTGGQVLDEFPMIPCMAEPGNNGRIVQIPYWFFQESTGQPSREEQGEFLLSLFSIEEFTKAAAARRSSSPPSPPSAGSPLRDA